MLILLLPLYIYIYTVRDIRVFLSQIEIATLLLVTLRQAM